MIYVTGFTPTGGLPLFPLHTSFDLESKHIDSKSILEITSLFYGDLVNYFTKNPYAMKNMDRRKFEELIAELFRGFNFDVELTQLTRDGGKDIIAISHHNFIKSKYLIECKRPEPGNSVGVGVVRELMGVKVDDKATQAIAVTTTYFSGDAHKFQKRNEWDLELKEFDDIVKWLNDYERIKRANTNGY